MAAAKKASGGKKLRKPKKLETLRPLIRPGNLPYG
jgi:hypothetical protein